MPGVACFPPGETLGKGSIRGDSGPCVGETAPNTVRESLPIKRAREWKRLGPQE